MSINGVHSGLRLPLRIEATSEARCPTVCPLASTTYHFRLPASSFPLGKYVDIVNYLCFQRVKRERLEYKRPKKLSTREGANADGVHYKSHEKALRDAEGPQLLSYHKTVTACRGFLWCRCRFSSASAEPLSVAARLLVSWSCHPVLVDDVSESAVQVRRLLHPLQSLQP